MDPANPFLYIVAVFIIGFVWLIYTIVFDKNGVSKLTEPFRTSFTSNYIPHNYNADLK